MHASQLLSSLSLLQTCHNLASARQLKLFRHRLEESIHHPRRDLHSKQACHMRASTVSTHQRAIYIALEVPEGILVQANANMRPGTGQRYLLNAWGVPVRLPTLLNKQRSDALCEISAPHAAMVHHAKLCTQAILQACPGALSNLPQGHLL